MRTVLSVVGTRPELVQAAPVSRALHGRCREIIVHTGQHYDDDMSKVFFEDLGLPEAQHELGAGSGSQAEQTAAVMIAMERVITAERPDVVLVRGDTNGGLGAALATAKLQVPLAHAEAGPRSFNRTIPEEINRIVIDHVSDQLYCPTERAVANLVAESVKGVHLTGDVTADSFRLNSGAAVSRRAALLERVGVRAGAFVLATIHRASNTDVQQALVTILQALGAIGSPVVLPLHPRTAKMIDRWSLAIPPSVTRVAPVPYLDMLALLSAAKVCVTDSGGLQKESYLSGTPCVTLREDTEWWETIEAGWNVLVGTDRDRIADAARSFAPPVARPTLFGDGHAAERMAELLVTGRS